MKVVLLPRIKNRFLLLFNSKKKIFMKNKSDSSSEILQELAKNPIK